MCLLHTIGSRSLDPFYIVSHFIRMDKTFWTYSKIYRANLIWHFNYDTLFLDERFRIKLFAKDYFMFAKNRFGWIKKELLLSKILPQAGTLNANNRKFHFQIRNTERFFF